MFVKCIIQKSLCTQIHNLAASVPTAQATTSDATEINVHVHDDGVTAAETEASLMNTNTIPCTRNEAYNMTNPNIFQIFPNASYGVVLADDQLERQDEEHQYDYIITNQLAQEEPQYQNQRL